VTGGGPVHAKPARSNPSLLQLIAKSACRPGRSTVVRSPEPHARRERKIRRRLARKLSDSPSGEPRAASEGTADCGAGGATDRGAARQRRRAPGSGTAPAFRCAPSRRRAGSAGPRPGRRFQLAAYPGGSRRCAGRPRIRTGRFRRRPQVGQVEAPGSSRKSGEDVR